MDNKTKDAINPDHYKQGAIECIEALDAAIINKNPIEAYHVANIIKYLWRYEAKKGAEDIQKALWYTNRLLEIVKKREEKKNKLTENASSILEGQFANIEIRGYYKFNNPLYKNIYQAVGFSHESNNNEVLVQLIEVKTRDIIYEKIKEFNNKYTLWKDNKEDS